MRIALAHDWLCGFRGGEAVVERLARLVLEGFEPAGLYTMFDEKAPMRPAIDALRARGGVAASPLNGLPGAAGVRRWMFPAYPWAVQRLGARLVRDHERRPIDLLISTSSAAIKGLRPPRGVPHLCMCFAPARYVWSRGDEYAGGLRGLGLRLAGDRFRRWDRATAAHVTRFVGISRHIQSEIRRCYGCEAGVLYPPTDTGFYTPAPVRRQGFWLSVGALEPYKRVDLAIRAAGLAQRRLVVVGTGSMERALRRIAGPTVEFAGRVDDHRLRDLYRTATAFIFPQIEDYGIVAIEAQACGLPVVAFRATPESLVAAADRLPGDCADACRRNAERFSAEVFDAAMRREIESLRGLSRRR
jgi:glycosyltransferase involved in cell wall biosynthesis